MSCDTDVSNRATEGKNYSTNNYRKTLVCIDILVLSHCYSLFAVAEDFSLYMWLYSVENTKYNSQIGLIN